jgi:hypothetical protein
MILQSGLESQIDNLVTLIGTTDIHNARSLNSLESVQIAYRSFIERLQKRTLDGEPGKVNIICDAEKAKKLRPFFINDSLLDDKHQNEVISSEEDGHTQEKSDLIHRARKQIANLCPQHAALFDTIITDIFILPSSVAKGGSTSQAIGVMWANPHIDYSINDVMEMLLHEFTHHTLFIDELRYSHYDYSAITNKSTWARSAILNISRPLDKVLHSVVVSMEILLLREHHIGHPAHPRVHPPTAVMLSQLVDAIVSIESVLFNETSIKRQFFRPRAMDVLHRVKQHLKYFEIPTSGESLFVEDSRSPIKPVAC